MDRKELIEFLSKLQGFEDQLKDDSIDINYEELNDLFHNLMKADMSNQSMKIPVKIKKLNPDAVIPKYSKPGDAGMDLTITSIIKNDEKSVTYGFGLSMEIPFGYVGLIYPRSSVRNYDLILSNSVGVIDSGYRGEIQSTFIKTKDLLSKIYEVNERGAQIMIVPYPQIEFTEVNELSNSERGDGGFGSTGL